MQDTTTRDIGRARTVATRPQPTMAALAAVAAGAKATPLHIERTAWRSSLAATDLACLLQVIESQLLPRLLREYRPADHSPLQSSRPG